MPLATPGQVWDKHCGCLESGGAGDSHRHGRVTREPSGCSGQGGTLGPQQMALGSPDPTRPRPTRAACWDWPHLVGTIFFYLHFIKSKWKCLHRLVASLISKHRLIVGWSRGWGCQPYPRRGPGWQPAAGTERAREEPRSHPFRCIAQEFCVAQPSLASLAVHCPAPCSSPVCSYHADFSTVAQPFCSTSADLLPTTVMPM